MRAASDGHFEVVKILCDHHAEVNGTALLRAAFFGHTEVINILCEYGANVDFRQRWNGGLMFIMVHG